MSIIGIPSRVSDLFVQQQLVDQMNTEQTNLEQVENQLSTGYQFSVPSQNPTAAMNVIGIQQSLAQLTQVQSNASTAQSYLNASDSALSQVASLLSNVRATALGVMGTSTPEQLTAAAQMVQQATQELVSVGNQQFDGRYLFSGADTGVVPFVTQSNGLISYAGNDGFLQGFDGTSQGIDTNVTGDQVFGAMSAPAGDSSTVLTPALTYSTPLADLRGGQGIDKGSIAISDGTNTSIIDLSKAATIGDVAQLIKAHPPAGNAVQVQITPTGLTIQLQSGNLSVNEVGGGTTAHDLGIYTGQGVGTQPVSSGSLDPVLEATTPLSDLLGSPAGAVISTTGSNSDILLQGDSNGTALNGITVSFSNDPTVTAGNEKVVYDPNAHTISIAIQPGVTTADDVVAAINAAHASGTPPVPFTAELDPLDGAFAGSAVLNSQGIPAVTTSGGSGQNLDLTGLQIVNNGSTYTISLAGDKTVQDLLTSINSSGAGVVAAISQDRQFDHRPLPSERVRFRDRRERRRHRHAVGTPHLHSNDAAGPTELRARSRNQSAGWDRFYDHAERRRVVRHQPPGGPDRRRRAQPDQQQSDQPGQRHAASGPIGNRRQRNPTDRQ